MTGLLAPRFELRELFGRVVRLVPVPSPPLFDPIEDQFETGSELFVVVVSRIAQLRDDLEEVRVLVDGGWVLFE